MDGYFNFFSKFMVGEILLKIFHLTYKLTFFTFEIFRNFLILIKHMNYNRSLWLAFKDRLKSRYLVNRTDCFDLLIYFNEMGVNFLFGGSNN